MTRRREGQRAFGQVVLFGLLGPPETLLDPALRRIDGLLDDEALVDAVWRAPPSRYPPNARRRRAAAPAAAVVRLFVVYHIESPWDTHLPSEGHRSLAGPHP